MPKIILTGKLSLEEKLFLETYYPVKGKVWCAKQLNRTVPSIRQHVARLGLVLSKDSDFFREFQSRAAQSKVGKKRPEHSDFMRSLRKLKPVIHTNDGLRKIGESSSERIKVSGHPRGMLGKNHSSKTIENFSINRLGKKKNLSEKQRQKISDRSSKMMNERIRTKGSCYSRTKNGWYILHGERFYFRSSWEVVYARYLDFLVSKKEIKRWEYESETFWFEKIKRGVRSYNPDFKVFLNSGSIEYHEVKGWMDDKSKTKLKRMKKYYPEVTMVLIDKDVYKGIAALERMFPEAIPESMS